MPRGHVSASRAASSSPVALGSISLLAFPLDIQPNAKRQGRRVEYLLSGPLITGLLSDCRSASALVTGPFPPRCRLRARVEILPPADESCFLIAVILTPQCSVSAGPPLLKSRPLVPQTCHAGHNQNSFHHVHVSIYIFITNTIVHKACPLHNCD